MRTFTPSLLHLAVAALPLFSVPVFADGLERAFYPDGKPRRIAWRENGVDKALLRFDGRGRVAEITCARGRDLIRELHERCGFAGRRETVIDEGGGDQRRLTFDKGLLVEWEIYSNRRLTDSVVIRNGERVKRSFHPNSKLETESVTRVDADGKGVVPRNELTKSFDMEGRLKSEWQWRDDVLVVEDSWYPSGAKRQEIRRSRKVDSPQREVVTVTRRFYENGRLIEESRTVPLSDSRAVAAAIEKGMSSYGPSAFERAAVAGYDRQCAGGEPTACIMRDYGKAQLALCAGGNAAGCKLAYCWFDPGSTRCLSVQRRRSGDGCSRTSTAARRGSSASPAGRSTARPTLGRGRPAASRASRARARAGSLRSPTTPDRRISRRSTRRLAQCAPRAARLKVVDRLGPVVLQEPGERAVGQQLAACLAARAIIALVFRVLVEVTPKSIRLRKRFLSEHERKRASRDEKAA